MMGIAVLHSESQLTRLIVAAWKGGKVGYFAPSPVRRTRRPFRTMTLLLLMTVLAASGCAMMPSHVHNDANAKTALQVQTYMADYAKNSPNMYMAMLSNLEKFKVEEEYLLTELATNYYSSLITQLPTMTWTKFSERIEECQKMIGEFQEKVLREAKKRKWVEEEAKDAKQAVEAAKKRVEEAKKTVTAWNAYVAFIQQGFRNIPKDYSQLNKDTDIQTLMQVVDDAKKKEITYMDANGGEKKTTIREVLKDRMPSKEDWQKFKVLPDAPGITLLIMNMGLELAQIRQKKAESELARFNSRAALFEDAYILQELSMQLLKEAKKTAGRREKGGTPFATIADVRQRALKSISAGRFNDFTNDNNTIANVLLALRKETLAESIMARNQSLFDVTLARLDHQDSIYESIAGDAAWQAVIRSGIEGMAAYHQSGFSAEDAANIIRIAQTIALAFIAVGTN